MGSKLTNLTPTTTLDTGDLLYVARTVGDTGVSASISRKTLDGQLAVSLSRATDTGKYLSDSGVFIGPSFKGDTGDVMYWGTDASPREGPKLPQGASAGGTLADTGTAQTLSGKTLSGSSIADTGVQLAAYFAAGAGADTGSFLRGDGSWAKLLSVPSSFIEIRRDSAPLNYTGTRASLILQHRDTDSGGSNELIPGAVFQFTATGNGNVTAGSDLSLSIWQGLRSHMAKSGDGSGHSFTATGELGAYGVGTYNEFGLFVGSATNTASLHGTMAGVEVLLQDSPDSGTTDFDTTMNAVIGRVARYNAGSRKSRNFYASSEGTVAMDAILGVNTGGLHSWVNGIDLTGATFSAHSLVSPNNIALGWRNAANSANVTLLFMSGADETWLLTGGTAKLINFANSSLAKGFTIQTVASAVNNVQTTPAIATASPSLAAIGSDTNINLALTAKGTGNITTVDGIRSSNATKGIGYATGAGGTVTQLTNKSTGVTLNTATGQITMNGAALAAATIVSFTLTNSAIAAGDILVLNHISAGTAGAYTLNAQSAAGSASINVRNATAGSLSEAIVISFAVIKAVTA